MTPELIVLAHECVDPANARQLLNAGLETFWVAQAGSRIAIVPRQDEVTQTIREEFWEDLGERIDLSPTEAQKSKAPPEILAHLAANDGQFRMFRERKQSAPPPEPVPERDEMDVGILKFTKES